MTLREARTARGWTQRELARRAGGKLDAAAICDFEHGRLPGLANARRLASALGVSLDALWGTAPSNTRPIHGRPRRAAAGRGRP